MLHSVSRALVVAGLLFLSLPLHAQATQPAFAFCTITDRGSAQVKIWATTILPVEHATDDLAGSRRSQELAAEFLAWMQGQGGQGDKSCIVAATAQELAALREQQRSIWGKRVFMVKVGDWRDVAWTPKPWNPGTVATATTAAPALTAATVTRYFLCSATQTDIPDGSDRARSVVANIFARSVSGENALAAGYAQAQAFAQAFQSIVEAHGVSAAGTCTPYDTLAEAQHAQKAQRRLFDGFNMKYTEVSWTPPVAGNAAPTPATSIAPPPPATAAAPSCAAPWGSASTIWIS
jgi:hypothetical protein